MSAAVTRSRTSPSLTPSAVVAVSADVVIPSVPAAIPLGRLLQQAGAAVTTGLPDPVWVVATVAAIKVARGGHSLELVEPDVAPAASGILRAYMPEAVVAAIRQRMQLAISADDLTAMTVTLQVRVELHPRWNLSGRVMALGPGIEVSLAQRAVAASLERLTRAGLLERQRRIPVPSAITRIAVIHPAAAAGWSDVAAELSRWSRAGVVAVRSVPTPFEGSGASTGLIAALGHAAAPLDGHVPDLLLVVRGGGSSASLASLHDEALARAVAVSPVPILTGLGHAVDLTLVDRVAWRSTDTPSKAIGLLRDLLVAPARRVRTDHAAILAAVTRGLDRAESALATLEQRATIEARRRAVAAAETLEHGWSLVHGASEAARERLGRIDDAVARLHDGIAQAAPLLLARLHAEIGTRMDVVRASARRSCARADDGTAILTALTVRAGALLAAADTTLTTCCRSIPTSVVAQTGRASADVAALSATARARARDVLHRADDGSGALASVVAATHAMRRDRDTDIERLHQAIETAALRRLDAAAASLDRAAATLASADPARALQQGCALVTDPAGRTVTSATAAAAAATLLITFSDGSLVVRVEPPSTRN